VLIATVHNHEPQYWFIVGTKKVMGTNYKANSPKSVTIFPDDDGAVLVSKTKPKQAFKKLLQNLKKKYLTEFSTD